MQKTSTVTAISFFIIFVLGWFLHGVFNKPKDCKLILDADEKVFEAWYVDDATKSADLLLEATKNRSEVIEKLGY
jgi:hypothetical protein